MNKELDNLLVPAELSECHSAQSEVMWFLSVLALRACLPPCEGGTCPQDTLPGLTIPFLPIYCA